MTMSGVAERQREKTRRRSNSSTRLVMTGHGNNDNIILTIKARVNVYSIGKIICRRSCVRQLKRSIRIKLLLLVRLPSPLSYVDQMDHTFNCNMAATLD